MTAPLPTLESPEPIAGQSLGAAPCSARNAAILKLWEHHRACMTYLIAGCYGSVASEARKLAKAATKVPPNDKQTASHETSN